MRSISIIIASRNRKNYLINLLHDINKQTFNIKEVLISDQSDKFDKIDSEKYHFNLIHFRNMSIGPCISRNDAVDKATGELFVFLDDDARIDVNFIEEIVTPILESKASACSGAIVNTNGDYPRNKKSLKVDSDGHFLIQLTKNPNIPKSGYCNSAPAGCYAILSEVFLELGKYDTFFDPNGAGEDRDFAIKMILNGYSTFYNHKAKLYHIGAEVGGRRSVKIMDSLAFRINIAYILNKYLGTIECNKYRITVCLERLKRILKFDMPTSQFIFLIQFLKSTTNKSMNT